jgi:hydroxymethylglutaryl-CoA lyase
MSAARSVVIREVGLRDGLQSIARILPTGQKLEWIREAYAAGQREMEVGSFVPARLLPQLADTAEVVAYARTLPGLCVSVLVPNLKGAERALESGADVMLLPLSASHAHSLANLRRTPDEVVAEIARIRAARDAAAFAVHDRGRHQHGVRLHDPGSRRAFRGAAPGAGGARCGRDRVGLADTVGYADPAMVRDLFVQAIRIAGARICCGHFHDTRGLGMANVYAAWQEGIDRFDACLAGIGGCPHAPGASGNVATEDVAYLFASMGVATGQDFDRLIALRAKVAQWLEGETLHGTLWRAGLPKTLTNRKRGQTLSLLRV